MEAPLCPTNRKKYQVLEAGNSMLFLDYLLSTFIEQSDLILLFYVALIWVLAGYK